MKTWLGYALDYIPRWIEFQARMLQQPGCIIAVSSHGKVVFEQAFGSANLATGETLTPRHRFRIGSQSKSFTAAAILKLREQGRLRLDDPADRFVAGLNPDVGGVTIMQLLSHSAGLIRDGSGAEQFLDRRPFLHADELITDLEAPLAVEPNTRFKYSNLGYGLLGLIVEAITNESFRVWMQREIIDRLGLTETVPDMPIQPDVPFASGHSGPMLLGRRLAIPGDFETHAICPAGGFVSTAADVVRFFAQLSPYAQQSVLSVASRREMIRGQWRNPIAGIDQSYGLGVVSGSLGGWDWFGHSGGLQGYISRTCVIPRQALAVSVLTNALDGSADAWADGIIGILRMYAENGVPMRENTDWSGRWWTLWSAFDLLPMGKKVMALSPTSLNPMLGAVEIEITGPDSGRLGSSAGYGNHGESVRCIRDASGRITEICLAATRLLPGPELARELQARYGAGVVPNLPPEPGVVVNQPEHRRVRGKTAGRLPS